PLPLRPWPKEWRGGFCRFPPPSKPRAKGARRMGGGRGGARGLATTQPLRGCSTGEAVSGGEGGKKPGTPPAAPPMCVLLAPRFLANIRAARRLFSEVGNWTMVIQLLDAELAATEDPAQKAALWFEKGTVLEDHLSRERDAADAFAQSLELRPNDLSLLVQLEAGYAAKNQYSSLVHVYRLMADAVADDPVRAYYLAAAGTLLEDRLKLPEEAADAFQQAFKINRRDPVVLASIVRLAEQQGRNDELIAALSAQAELPGPQA